MHDISWSNSEKQVARAVFECALQKELSDIIIEFKRAAASISEPDELWSLTKRTDQKRREIDFKYDYRYSQLLHVFGRLLREGRIAEEDLQGLGEKKVAIIRTIAEL
ncbi:MAG TPA: hypothetical protein VLA61_07360 [Ideonella sp.]|uniref:hypothetical protein n=1 Tax=Ideonella sp. TaxID=1929293 RepID=UPI002D036AA2|nr:hypothetical protein [Ideonella sp.]HSI48070.1 hypothetical protein [Ideonella sp.]